MKRTIFLLIPLVIGLSACSNSSSSISNQEVVNEIKELLNKQDLSEFHTKSMGTMFTQEYDVLDLDKDDEEKYASYFNYIGLGFLDFYYVLNEDQYDSVIDENGDINTFDAIAIGDDCGFRIMQSANTTSFFRDGGTPADVQNLNLVQNMTIKTTDEDVLIDNSFIVTDTSSFDYSTRQEFYGAINKELLFDSISIESFRDTFTRVHLFNAPGNIEYLDRLYYLKCRELVNMSDKEISDFIIENQISISEGEETILVNFVFPNDNLDDEYAENIFPGAVEGTLTYDKETGEFALFEYQIKYNYYSYDEETGSNKLINTVFNCAGISSHEKLGELSMAADRVVYDDVVEFMNDVSEQVVPPSIYQ